MSTTGTASGPRLWLAPRNDGEAIEIARMLEAAGERVLISGQRWGATWAGLEPELTAAIRDFQRERPGGRIYGVELAGPNPFGATDLDHHRYGPADDRSHPLSSLEQAAAILGVTLDRRQTLVALNDRGYIPAMERFGATAAEIAEVRRQDREAQGVAPEQEAAAERDLAKLALRADGRRASLWCPDGFTSAHADRLHGVAAEVLLMSPGEWAYYGPRHREADALGLGEKHWSGGSAESGYFGVERPGAESQGRLRGWFEGGGGC